MSWIPYRLRRYLPLARSPIAVGLIAVVALLVVGRLLGPLLWWALLATVSAATYVVVRPDFDAAFGRGDQRPWLVRLREHRWRRIRLPVGWSLPRSLAYALLAIGWWWLLR